VRILSELRRCFLDVRILQELVNHASRAVNGRRGEMVRDLMRRTQKSIARDYQVAKYYAWNSKNWWVNGRWKALNGGWLVLLHFSESAALAPWRM
jgi:hypothetical protein